MEKTQVRITWNGMGGELDSTIVTLPNVCGEADLSTTILSEALAKMIRGTIVSPGDSFTVQDVE